MSSNNGIFLYGSVQTRSPLVNWYLIELNIPFTQKPPRPSNHPFGQIPFLTDKNNQVEIFESGAILLYLADEYGGYSNSIERASYTKWVVWANSELDALCFGRGMSGTKIDKPNVKQIDKLEQILSSTDYLINNQFSVADVAVCSYLNYVPIFFRDVNLSIRPNIVKYMDRCAKRPAFIEAFGEDHAAVILSKANEWINKSNKGKSLFGF
eukprot:gene18295-23977_t